MAQSRGDLMGIAVPPMWLCQGIADLGRLAFLGCKAGPPDKFAGRSQRNAMLAEANRLELSQPHRDPALGLVSAPVIPIAEQIGVDRPISMQRMDFVDTRACPGGEAQALCFENSDVAHLPTAT